MIELRNENTELSKSELPALRAKTRVSQQDLINKIGISRQTYCSVETGKKMLRGPLC